MTGLLAPIFTKRPSKLVRLMSVASLDLGDLGYGTNAFSCSCKAVFVLFCEFFGGRYRGRSHRAESSNFADQQ